mmetsp:Transcript_5270/g.4467  ORF Transcript_5270/g.4467 Transcript_5270/m.4467 type:complete len:93 (+) Transcript_5270:185-463(+)
MGYIVPTTYRVTKARTDVVNGQVFFGAGFKTEAPKKIYIYLLCNKDGLITDMSASAITMMNLSLANLKKAGGLNIDMLIPNILQDETRFGGV